MPETEGVAQERGTDWCSSVSRDASIDPEPAVWKSESQDSFNSGASGEASSIEVAGDARALGDNGTGR